MKRLRKSKSLNYIGLVAADNKVILPTIFHMPRILKQFEVCFMLNHQCRSNIYDLATETEVWKTILQDSFTDIESLLDYLDIPLADTNYSSAANKIFPLKVPKTYVDKMQKGDTKDPLLLQVLPIAAETIEKDGFYTDPVGDYQAIIGANQLQKYRARTLLLTTNSCSINCRFCFRKNMLIENSDDFLVNKDSVFANIAADNSLEEVILSGGEPLLLDDNDLIDIFSAIESIEHIKRIRIHSRILLTIPHRLTTKLLSRLAKSNKQIILVIHCNHPQEIDSIVEKKLQEIDQYGITTLNQSVLLKGVNNSPEILNQLSKKLFNNKVMPYYLHLLDRVKGASHFLISDNEAKKIWSELQAQLPGYLVPRLVRESANTPSKTIIS